MTTLAGKVVNVYTRAAGANVAQDYTTAAPYISVDSAYPFEEEGGTIVVNGEQLNYSHIEWGINPVDESFETVDRLFLVGVPSVPGTVDDFVSTYPASTYRLCQVQLPDSDEGVQAVIPFAMSAIFAEDGIREEEAQESVYITEEQGRWVVSAADEEEAIVSGYRVDPEGLPTQGSDGLPPEFAPVLVAESGFKSIFYKWTSVPNDDPLTYKLYVRRDTLPTTTDGTYLVASGDVNQAVIRKAMAPTEADPLVEELADVESGFDYYAVVTAEDIDGVGPPSLAALSRPGQVTGPDIAVGAIATEHLLANSITADRLASELFLSSRINVGDTFLLSGLDVESYPNMLPTLTEPTRPAGDFPASVAQWYYPSTDTHDWNVESVELDPLDPAPIMGQLPLSGQAFTVDLPASASLITTSVRVSLKRPRVAGEIWRFGAGIRVSGVAVRARVTMGPWGDTARGSLFDQTVAPSNLTTVVSAPYFPAWNEDALEPTYFLRLEVSKQVNTAASIEFISPSLRSIQETPNHFVAFDQYESAAELTTAFGTNNQGSAVADSALTLFAMTGNSVPTNTSWTAGLTESVLAVTSGYESPAVGSLPGTLPGFHDADGPVWNSNGHSYARTFVQTIVPSATPAGNWSLTTRVGINTVPTRAFDEKIMLHWTILGNLGAVPGNTRAQLNLLWYDSGTTLLANVVLYDHIGAHLAGVENVVRYTEIPDPPEGANRGVLKLVMSYNNTVTLNSPIEIGLGGMKLYVTKEFNYRYGQLTGQRLVLDQNGLLLVNKDDAPQVLLSTDPEATNFFRGAGEFESLRITGGTSIESKQNEMAKDSSLVLAAGTASPVSVPTIVQKYDQPFTVPKQTTWTGKVFDPSKVISMAHAPGRGFLVAQSDGNGAYTIFEIQPGGNINWQNTWTGYSQFAVWVNPEWVQPDGSKMAKHGVLTRFNTSLTIWFYPTNTATDSIYNILPSTSSYYFDSTKQHGVAWNTNNDRLYLAENISTSQMATKVFAPVNTNGASPAGAGSYVSASGTGSSAGVAGLVVGNADFGGSRYIKADQSTGQIHVTSGSTTGNNAGERWSVPASPKAFCWDGFNFWMIDSSGRFWRFSGWKWNETNHKFYAGLTWYDSDPVGSTHETDLTRLASVTAQKRIASIEVTAPPVPDKGGVDDPDKFRLYMAKSSSIVLPANRTSMWLQAEGGDPAVQSTVSIPENGIITSSQNPPALNNFPGSNPAEFKSSKEDASGPLILLKGDGSGRTGSISWTNTGQASGAGRLQAGVSTYRPTASTGAPGARLGSEATPTVWSNSLMRGFSYNGAGAWTCLAGAAGTYLVFAKASWATDTTADWGCGLQVWKDGVQMGGIGHIWLHHRALGNSTGPMFAGPIEIAVGEVMEMSIWQNSGTAKTPNGVQFYLSPLLS